MDSVHVIYKGIFVVVIFTIILIILGPTIEVFPVFLSGFLIIGMFVGYITYGSTIMSLINSAIIGVAEALILWILSFTLQSFVPLTSPPELLIMIIIATVGGALGSFIYRLNQKNRRYNRKVRDDRDRRDDRYWRD